MAASPLPRRSVSAPAAVAYLGSSATVLGWLPGLVVPFAVGRASAGESWVVAGGTLGLTGSSDVVRPLPAAPHNRAEGPHRGEVGRWVGGGGGGGRQCKCMWLTLTHASTSWCACGLTENSTIFDRVLHKLPKQAQSE